MFENQDVSSGKVVFSTTDENNIVKVTAYLKAVEKLKIDYANDPNIFSSLGIIEAKLKALQWSELNEMEIETRLHEIARIPLGESYIDLRSLIPKESRKKIKSREEFKKEVLKKVTNTIKVIKGLLAKDQTDETLRDFLVKLNDIDSEMDVEIIQNKLQEIFQGQFIVHYDDIKRKTLLEWLTPFQEFFDKPIASLTKDELAKALKKVESLKKSSLEESGIVLNEDHALFYEFNRKMHPLVNGQNLEFWGSTEIRGEFIILVNKILDHFRFQLEDQFLVFSNMDHSMSYLLGFSDDSFAEVEYGNLSAEIYPHVKVLLKIDEELHKELTRDNFSDPKEYYKVLKTSLVPFLASMALMVDLELSEAFRSTFDMWL